MKSIYSTCICVFISFSLFAQWTDSTDQNVQISTLNSADIQSIGVAGGKTWIAFYSQRGNTYDMRAQLLDSTGQKLFGDDGILVSKNPSGSATYVFNVSINGKGELLIGYQYEINGVLNAVVSKVNQNGNLTWGANGVVLGPGLSPYPAVITSGETVVVWNDSNTGTISLQRIAADGTVVADSAVSIRVGTANTTRGQVVANLNGNYTVIFQQAGFGINSTLYAERFSRYFKPLWPQPVQLSNQATSAARYYSVSAESDTTYVGYYSSVGSRFNAFVQRINPDSLNILPYGINGAHFSTDTATNSNYQQTITIAQQDSAIDLWAVCTYSNPSQTEYGVYAQRFLKADGSVLFGNKAKQVFPITTALTMQQGELQLTGDDKPGFITNDITNQIYATKLDDFGNFYLNLEALVLASSGNPKSRFCFAANDVLAVAIWSEDRGNGEMPFAQNITGKGFTGVLPVVISNFKAVKDGEQADLSWTSVTETNNKGFYIERSADGINFSSSGYVASKANGSNMQNIGYTFTDKFPLQNNNYYRLKMVSNNGSFTYSETVMITFRETVGFVVSELYPNPAKNIITLLLESSQNRKVTAIIVSASGKTITEQSFAITTGSHTLPIHIQSLSAGNYFIKLYANGVEKTVTFTKL